MMSYIMFFQHDACSVRDAIVFPSFQRFHVDGRKRFEYAKCGWVVFFFFKTGKKFGRGVRFRYFSLSLYRDVNVMTPRLFTKLHRHLQHLLPNRQLSHVLSKLGTMTWNYRTHIVTSLLKSKEGKFSSKNRCVRTFFTNRPPWSLTGGWTVFTQRLTIVEKVPIFSNKFTHVL